MGKPILALTLHPEWAHAVTHLDKRAENRGPTFAAQIASRVGDGWLAIHAGKSIGGRPGPSATRAGLSAVAEMAADAGWKVKRAGGESFRFVANPLGEDVDILLSPSTPVTSAIVALVRLDSLILWGQSAPWKVRLAAALVLSDVVVLAEPIACKGRQGLWTPDDDVQERLRAALEKPCP